MESQRDYRGYEAKNIKSFDTTNGYAFRVSLYHNNEKLGTVFNEGRGGCHSYEPFQLEAKIRSDAETFCRETDGWWTDFDDEEMKYAEWTDWFVGELMEHAEWQARIKTAISVSGDMKAHMQEKP